MLILKEHSEMNEDECKAFFLFKGGNMNELTAEKLYTTKEVAGLLGTSPKVIIENARKRLPHKKIEHGKPTYWTQMEITILLLEFMKTNNLDLYDRCNSASTGLNPVLRHEKALELTQEGYEAGLSCASFHDFCQAVVNSCRKNLSGLES